MEGSYLQILFSTREMTSVFIAIMVVEMLSLGFLGLCTYEFQQLLRRHSKFFHAIGNNGEHKRVEWHSRIICWIYVISTLAVTAITSALFIVQPHIL